MIEWIIDNKEWLFSGIGVTIISVFWLLWERSKKKEASSTITPPQVTAKTFGNSAPAIAIGGDVKNSKIVFNADEQRRKGITKEVKPIVNDILNFTESVKPSFPDLSGNDPIIAGNSDTLKRDPYNIQALLIRGQAYYTNAMSFGGKGMREALADFERAAETDMKLGDPHFGIGTVLYILALLDLTRRGRYKINKKGGLRINKSTGLLEMRPPDFELFVDERNRSLLQAALEEFQEGNSLRQSYNRVKDGTSFFFAPRDVENRIRSLRCLLSYEPISYIDQELIKTLTMALTKIDPIAFEQLFEIQKD